MPLLHEVNIQQIWHACVDTAKAIKEVKDHKEHLDRLAAHMPEGELEMLIRGQKAPAEGELAETLKSLAGLDALLKAEDWKGALELLRRCTMSLENSHPKVFNEEWSKAVFAAKTTARAPSSPPAAV